MKQQTMMALEAEQQKAALNKQVRQLAAHLVMKFNINGHDQSLVMSLSDGSVNNNLEAVKFWLAKQSVNNAGASKEFWENQLGRTLSDICYYRSDYTE